MTLKGLIIVVAALLAASCASQPTQMQIAAKEAAARKAGTYKQEDTGPYRKVVRDGKTLYCETGPQLGSKLAKPVCLTEAQYAQWKENNATIRDDMRRGSNMITTDNRDAPRTGP